MCRVSKNLQNDQNAYIWHCLWLNLHHWWTWQPWRHFETVGSHRNWCCVLCCSPSLFYTPPVSKHVKVKQPSCNIFHCNLIFLFSTVRADPLWHIGAYMAKYTVKFLQLISHHHWHSIITRESLRPTFNLKHALLSLTVKPFPYLTCQSLYH